MWEDLLFYDLAFHLPRFLNLVVQKGFTPNEGCSKPNKERVYGNPTRSSIVWSACFCAREKIHNEIAVIQFKWYQLRLVAVLHAPWILNLVCCFAIWFARHLSMLRTLNLWRLVCQARWGKVGGNASQLAINLWWRSLRMAFDWESPHKEILPQVLMRPVRISFSRKELSSHSEWMWHEDCGKGASSKGTQMTW